MKDKVSVIIPVYNVEKYINRCIESVIKQTYTNLEILLIDDGSKDSSSTLCDFWEDKDNRIRVIHKTNGGLSSARNKGLDYATGEYICFVDSDDYISKKMIEIMHRAAIEEDVQVVTCGRIRVKKEEQILLYTLPEQRKMSGKEAIKELLVGGCIEEAAWDKLYSRKIFMNRRFPMGEINEDIVQTIDILGECEKIVHVGEPLYYYCENQGSITKSAYSKTKMVAVKHLEMIESYLKNNFPDLLEMFDSLQLRYCQDLLYLILDDKKTLKTYKQDYDIIYAKFKKSFSNGIKNKKIKNSDKIKAYLILFNLYFTVHRLKKKIDI